MRAFAGGFYDNLRLMYDHLNVRYQSQPFLYNFTKLVNPWTQPSAYFIHSSNNHRIPPIRPNQVHPLMHVVEMVYLLVCYAWFSICCFVIAPKPSTENTACESVGDYLQRVWLPAYFTTNYLLPLMSSVTTCPHETLLRFPANDLVRYKRKTHNSQHYTVATGVQDVQRKLTKGLNIRLLARVVAVKPQRCGKVRVCWENAEETPGTKTTDTVFDRVILAVPPDVVRWIFEPLRHDMSRIPTTMVTSVVHTKACTADGPKDPASIDLHSPNSTEQTIHLRTSTSPISQTESIHVQPSGVLVTTCPIAQIPSSQIIKSSTFTRVLRTPESRQIVNSIFASSPSNTGAGWKNGDGGVWLAGGWCWDGMVLLEGCVVSAMRIAEGFGVEVPWRRRQS